MVPPMAIIWTWRAESLRASLSAATARWGMVVVVVSWSGSLLGFFMFGDGGLGGWPSWWIFILLKENHRAEGVVMDGDGEIRDAWMQVMLCGPKGNALM